MSVSHNRPTIKAINTAKPPRLSDANNKSSNPKTGMLRLASQGKFCTAIDIRPTQSAGLCTRAADELTHYLERSVGQKTQKLPRNNAETHTNTARIIIELNPTLDTNPESFTWTVNATAATLTSKTTPGIEHGVHWFLEKFLGIRWLWPGSTGEVVPSHPTLHIPHGQWLEQPDFAWRRIGLGGALLERHDYESANRNYLRLDQNHDIEFQRWAWRNRLGGLNIADGHLLGEMLPAENLGEDHPEYFALVDNQRDAKFHNGKHNNQPCTTNPESLNHIAQQVIARFKNDPTLDAVSVGLNDGWRLCQCENCKAIDQQFKNQKIIHQHAAMAADIDPPTSNHVDGTVRTEKPVTDRIFTYVNDMWQRIEKHCPDKKLLMLIYAACRTPPTSTRLPNQVIAQFCTMCNRYTDANWREQEMKQLQKLSDFAENIGIYEYYEQGAWPAIMRLFPRLASQSIKDFHDAGARYFATQPGYGFATNGLNFFVLSRMLWDVNANVEEIIHDYCLSAFGSEAATTMQRFFDAFEQRWVDCDALQNIEARHPLLGIGELYPDDFLHEREQDLQRAYTQCNNDDQRARVAFIRRGFELTCAVQKAFVATNALQKTLAAEIWDDDFARHIPNTSTEQQRSMLARALVLWQHATQVAEQYHGQFVYSEFWFQYTPGLQHWPRPMYWQRPLKLIEKSWSTHAR